MSPEQSEAYAMLLICKGAVSELEPDEQVAVNTAVDEIREVVAKHGQFGNMALTMASLEFAVEENADEAVFKIRA